MRCEARTAAGTRCTRNHRVSFPYSDKASVEAAIRSGWPMMVRGMKSPATVGHRHLCNQHDRQREASPSFFRWARGVKAVAVTETAGEINARLGDPWKDRLAEWREQMAPLFGPPKPASEAK